MAQDAFLAIQCLLGKFPAPLGRAIGGGFQSLHGVGGLVQIQFLRDFGERAEGLDRVVEKALQNLADFFLLRRGFHPLGGVGFFEISGELFGLLDVGFLEFEQLVNAGRGGVRELVFLR